MAAIEPDATTYQDAPSSTRGTVVTEHFLRVTLPFIDSTRSLDQIVSRILRGEI